MRSTWRRFIVVVMDTQRHGYKDNTRSISRRGSNSRAYVPMMNLINRGLRPACPAKLPHGKGMTSMDTSSTRKRRTRRAQHRTVGFDMRASTRLLGRPRHTMGKLKRYENLTTTVNFPVPVGQAECSCCGRVWTNHCNF